MEDKVSKQREVQKRKTDRKGGREVGETAGMLSGCRGNTEAVTINERPNADRLFCGRALS